ncbi:MAG TPA: FAD-dependent oxidoreductase [Armatimonadota bacterium]|nr:FAD-dependent oxidoreductase [Armatimonadota bacterium]
MERLPDVDVLVAGGGPAGIGAAIAAARRGASTLLIERYGFLGGVAAHGMGMPVNQMRPGGCGRSAVHEMIVEAVQAYGGEAVSLVDHALVCNVEYLKVAVMEALDSVECRYALHSRVVDAVVEGERLVGAVVGMKEGLREVRAKVFVEATGDADLAHYAGAETMKGREGDGFLSPMTLCFVVANVDVEGARAYAEGDEDFAELLARARSTYPLLPESMILEKGPFPLKNHLAINHAGTRARGALDGTNTEEMTEAERFSRRQVLEIAAALREFGGPAFARAQLAGTGAQVGVRETRRVKGRYVLTEEDAMSGRRFEDAVSWRSGYLDVGWVRWEPMKVHDVPYRALVPERLEGLVVAGRCISATHVGASSGKSMGNCMATGHAGGLAAAMCAAKGCAPGELNVGELQQALAEEGVDLRWEGENRP